MAESDTPKPKPGSLRDRIAAFERPQATTSNAPPPIRPKPGTLGQWKPKPVVVESPAPTNTDAADPSEEKKSSGLSASDARESIAKAGGSLKERMAALQGRGAFGAGPSSIAPPLPSSEGKPRVWKTTTPDEPTTTAAESGDPAEPKPEDEQKNAEAPETEEPSPEDEERDRRAAIAARMARLGGARVGIAPVYGSKPVIPPKPKLSGSSKGEDLDSSTEPERKPTLETALKIPLPASKDSLLTPVSPGTEITSPLESETDSKKSTAGPRSPDSMPLPAIPRRAVPPRRKSAKNLKAAAAETPPEVPLPTSTEETPALPEEATETKQDDDLTKEYVLKQDVTKTDEKYDADDVESAATSTPHTPPPPSPSPSTDSVLKTDQEEEPAPVTEPVTPPVESDDELDKHLLTPRPRADSTEEEDEHTFPVGTKEEIIDDTKYETANDDDDDPKAINLSKRESETNVPLLSRSLLEPEPRSETSDTMKEVDEDEDDVDYPIVEEDDQGPTVEQQVSPVSPPVNKQGSPQTERPGISRPPPPVPKTDDIPPAINIDTPSALAAAISRRPPLPPPSSPPQGPLPAITPPMRSRSIGEVSEGDVSEGPKRPARRPAPTAELPLPPVSYNNPSPTLKAKQSLLVVGDKEEESKPKPALTRPAIPPPRWDEFTPEGTGKEKEVMSESETDPVDPGFVKGKAFVNVSKPREASGDSEGNGTEPEDEEASRRRNIAARMARLGGIKFGMPMMAPPVRQVSSPQEEEPAQTHEEVVSPTEEGLSPEEAERARRAAITARVAAMGGRGFGMFGAAPAKAQDILGPPPPTSKPPNVPLPPTPSVPPPAGETSESEIEMLNAEEDDEEGEMVEEEVEEPEIIESSPPPLPAGRPAPRTSLPAPPTADDVAPPPLPGGRRTTATSPPNDYVMLGDDQTSPQVPALPKPRRSIPTPEVNTLESSGQWELPSIPNASLDIGYGGEASTSMDASWSEVEPAPAATSSPAAATSPFSGPSPPPISVEALAALSQKLNPQILTLATHVQEKSKKAIIGDGSSVSFLLTVLSPVPASTASLGYLIYAQTGGTVQKRIGDITPGDIVALYDAKFKGHKGGLGGLGGGYTAVWGTPDEPVLGVICEVEAKKGKIKAFAVNQHAMAYPTIDIPSYKLDDLKSGTVKVFRVAAA